MDKLKAMSTLKNTDLPGFFSYLDIHISENGRDGAPLFQPQSRSQKGFPKDREAGLVQGLSIPVGSPNWRRAWVYRQERGDMVGHIDLRARPEPYTSHRALLGMGVHQAFRGRGIGLHLIEHALQWAADSGVIDTIDLEVLAHNERAIRLYQKTGFDFLCRIDDMFRIDGRSEPYILMTRRLKNI